MSTIVRTLAYPLSQLSAINVIDQHALIELSINTASNSYVSRKTTINDFGNFILTSHAIFNRLNDLYNTVTDSIAFTLPTYFAARPYVGYDSGITNYLSSTYSTIADNNLVTLYDVKRHIADKGIALPAIGADSTYYKYDSAASAWIAADMPQVVAENNYTASIYSADNCMNLTSMSINGLQGYGTAECTANADMMLHVVANILLTETYNALTENAPIGYYRHDFNKIAMLLIDNNNVLCEMPFTDIINVNINATNYAVAQIIIDAPIAKNTKFKLFTPYIANTDQSQLAAVSADANFKRSLFSGLNTVNFSYFSDNWQ